MNARAFKFIDNKLIVRLKDRTCETAEELFRSDLFREILTRCVKDLTRKDSLLLRIFDKENEAIKDEDIDSLVEVFVFLGKMPIGLIPKVVKNSERFTRDVHLLSGFVEHLYNYWRDFERFIVCDSRQDVLDKRPYRTFNSTIENLTHLVRGSYRDIEENITGRHPNIYRQVIAGAEIATIVRPMSFPFEDQRYLRLNEIPVIRQILIYPPLLINPPMNKRSGSFQRVDRNPVDGIDIDSSQWLCYPAKVGSLLINIYFHEKFFDLGFSLCNLFALADDECLNRQPDAVYLFGVPGNAVDEYCGQATVFFDDEEKRMLVAAVPSRDEFGYFGYLKKMVLTLYNIVMMKKGRLPYHGAMVTITLKGKRPASILIIGDTGAGKSETLEAFRMISKDRIQEITIIADDMGSLTINSAGDIYGYGTEIGAFVRLDDLQPGFAFGQLDRTIIMNPNQVNARVVLPVTTYENIIRGVKVDYILYANNYEAVDEKCPIVERFADPAAALAVFERGTAMSKGTTTSSGLVHTYFVNIFGATQYRQLHSSIAERFFEQFFAKEVYVGQLRTQLGIPGFERSGPEAAATELLRLIQE